MKFVIIIISMVLVNNYPLAQFLGICPFLGVSKDLDSSTGMGIAVTFVMVLATAVTWPIQQLLNKFGIGYLQTVVFILVIAALVQLVEMFMKKSMPALYKSLGIFLPLITTNCAVLGVCITNIDSNYNYIESLVNAFGAGVGFLFAMIIMAGVRTKLVDQSRIPESFRGVPIVLITAAILSLSFMGFNGPACSVMHPKFLQFRKTSSSSTCAQSSPEQTAAAAALQDVTTTRTRWQRAVRLPARSALSAVPL